MSKFISPSELAEIVTALLIKPELLGELDSVEKHQGFFEDIAIAVSQHCGGCIGGVSPPETDENYLSDQLSTPYVFVKPDSDLPSLLNNVWASYDLEGFEFENNENAAKELEIDLGEVVTAEQADITRSSIREIFKVSEEKIKFSIKDWDEDSSQHEFNVELRIGNQTSVEIMDASNEPVMGLILEINKGVPAVHIDIEGSDPVIHIHKAPNGLVLCPDSSESCFESAPCNEYGYNDSRAILIN
jgi:hypothetical protein